MKLLVISIIILFISQSIKLLIYLIKGDKISRSLLLWVYIWTGEFPSTHAAILIGSVYVIGKEEGLSLFFAFSVIVSIFFIYRLLEDKKRQELLEEYFRNSGDSAIQKIVIDRRLINFSGHTYLDIAAGMILGLTVAITLNRYL